MTIADSDVLIDFLRGREPGVSRIRDELTAGRLATTAINSFELLSGTRSASQLSKVAALLSALTVLPVSHSTAAIAAELRRQLEKKGEGIGMADYLIAAVCLAHQAALLTRNLDHFARIPDLRIARS